MLLSGSDERVFSPIPLELSRSFIKFTFPIFAKHLFQCIAFIASPISKTILLNSAHHSSPHLLSLRPDQHGSGTGFVCFAQCISSFKCQFYYEIHASGGSVSVYRFHSTESLLYPFLLHSSLLAASYSLSISFTACRYPVF